MIEQANEPTQWRADSPCQPQAMTNGFKSCPDGNKLLDTVMERMQLKNDAALCRFLDVAPPLISKIRHRTLTVGPVLIIRLHEETGMSIKEIKALLST